MRKTFSFPIAEKKLYYHECAGSHLWWYKITETWHDSEHPHGFGRVDGDMVIFDKRTLERLVSTPNLFLLSETDVELIKSALSSDA